MNIISAQDVSPLQSALISAGRASGISEADDLYGWLIGSWELDVRNYWGNLSAHKLKAEAHFAWVLEGRAVQDVWIIPRPGERAGLPDPNLFSYGTTLRVWDPRIRAWRVTWINPVTGTHIQLIGRRQGSNIVQIGTNSEGTPIRWSFTEITPDSFRWTGETLQSDGETWLLQGDFVAIRTRA